MKAASEHISRYVAAVMLCIVSMAVSAQEALPADTLQVAVRDSLSAVELQQSVAGDSLAALTPEDSAMIEALMATKSAKVKRDMSKWRPDPKRAMWMALVIPGAGQIYNRKYWKLPIVYGGFLGCAYAMRWNNQMYMDYSQAYLDIMDDDPTTKSYTQFLHLGAEINSSNEERYKVIFKSRKDSYRRWRDLSFFCMLGVYALSVIDAYVDAQMSQFDISDDLSLRVAPAVIPGATHAAGRVAAPCDMGISKTALGIQGALTF